MKQQHADIHRFLKICMDIAEMADSKMEDIPFWDGLGLGCRALSGYMRQGVKGIIDLEHNYYNAKEKAKLAEDHEEEMSQFLEELFGDEEPEALNDEYRERLRTFVRTMLGDEDDE